MMIEMAYFSFFLSDSIQNKASKGTATESNVDRKPPGKREKKTVNITHKHNKF